MKELTNKNVSLGNDAVSYSQIISDICNAPRDGGVTVQQMSRWIRILDVVEKGGDSLSFEDNDFSFLIAEVEAFRFGAVSRGIAEFVADLKKLSA